MQADPSFHSFVFAEADNRLHQSRADAAQLRCDPIPMLLTETEFVDLTARLAQRATVIELMDGPRSRSSETAAFLRAMFLSSREKVFDQ